MRLHGYCMECRKIKVVVVRGPITGGLALGECDDYLNARSKEEA